jgi:hypothetical protein
MRNYVTAKSKDEAIRFASRLATMDDGYQTTWLAVTSIRF